MATWNLSKPFPRVEAPTGQQGLVIKVISMVAVMDGKPAPPDVLVHWGVSDGKKHQSRHGLDSLKLV